MNNSIDEFLSSLFVTTQLLSEEDFHEHLQSQIQQSKLNAPRTFTRILLLIENINRGNAFISTYGTNFEYITPLFGPTLTYAPIQSIIYDNNCTCGLNRNCTSQANFIQINSSEIIPIKGFKVGCIPSESFRFSTLECFYDQSCINLIEQYINNINSSISLSLTTS